MFLFSFSCLIFLFYIAGNWQGFLNENQKLLLQVTSISSILLLWFLVIGFVLLTVYSIKQKTLYFLRFIPLYLIYGIISFAIMLFCRGIIFLSR